jgi:cytidine deaminase
MAMPDLPKSSKVCTVSVAPPGSHDIDLCNAAVSVARTAYAPYSKFFVGAAVRSTSGKIYIGSNLENSSYGLTICAEVAALAAANSAGDFAIEAIAVVGYRSDHAATSRDLVTPCGRCRQIIFEAGQVARRDIRIISCNGDLSIYRTYLSSELLPNGFGPANLGTPGDTDAAR